MTFGVFLLLVVIGIALIAMPIIILIIWIINLIMYLYEKFKKH